MSRALKRRHSALQAYDSHIGPNMTPMVDIVMVILIFFMASAAILGPTWLVNSTLPPKPSPSVQPPKDRLTRIRVKLETKGQNTIARWTEAVGEAAAVPGPDSGSEIGPFERRLAELAKTQGASQLVVLIDPGVSVPYSDVVRLHAACQKLGVEKVGLAAAEE